MGTSTPYYTLCTSSRNFIDLHLHLSQAVNEFHVIIRHLASHPHAGSIQTLVKGMESYAQNFTQILDSCCTQCQREPPSHPTTALIIEDMISRIHGQLKGLYLLCEIALEMFNILQATNNSDPDHQGPPSNLYSSEISHQVSAPPNQNSLGISCQVSPPPNSSSLGICQQKSPPFFSDDTETYPHVSASPDQNSPEISHQVSAHNSDQTSTGEGWQHNQPNESDEPIQEVSWYDILGVSHEPDQNGKSENEVPLQEVSWYAIPGVLQNEITPNPPDSDNAQTKLSQGTKPTEQTSGNSTASPIVGNNETKILNNTYDIPVITSNNVAYSTVSPVVENSETKIPNNTYSNPVITNQDAHIANKARPQLHSKSNSAQYLDFSGKCTQPNSRSDNTKRSKKSTSRAQKPCFTRLSTHA